MTKIEKLTPKQMQQFPFYVDKWTRIGLDCSESNEENSKSAIAKLYQCGGLQPPQRIVYCDSPLSMYLTIETLNKIAAGDFSKKWASVRDSVRASVWDSVWDSVRDSVRDSVGDRMYGSVYGQHEASWLGFYEYFINECDILQIKEKLEGLFAVAQECHWIYPTKDICFVSRKPLAVRLSSNKKIHADGEAAIEYRDGFKIYALNGVRVDEQIALTPAEQLPAALITSEQNAEIRGEIVKKIGLTRIVRELHAKVLDSRSFSNETGEHSYQLLELDLGDTRRRPFLKMQNPSIDEVHIEGVNPSIRNVSQAIMFRNGLKPSQIDDQNGADYYQQGDVLFFPLDATKFKLFPKFLT